MNRNVKTLVIDNVSFRYNGGSIFIIDNFSMRIPNPSVTTLLGLNGSGKTTLLMLLLGYIEPNRGEIYFRVENHQVPLMEMKGLIGYLPQRENLPFDYSVRDFVLLGRNSHIGFFDTPGTVDIQKTDDALGFLDIADLADRKLSKISGGELQRVRIARLLVQDPQVILLDEPSSHLDVKSNKQIIELIGKLRDLGKIVIYSTHNALDALNYSDYSILMQKGKKIIAGESKDIVNKQTLTEYFETKVEISEINGTKVILVKNGYKNGV